jgi:hypothetical protein
MSALNRTMSTTRTRILALTALVTLPLASVGCGSSNSGGSGEQSRADGGTSGTSSGGDGGSSQSGADGGSGTGGTSPDGGSSTTDNSVPMIVNAGPANTDSVDVPFISVTICVPGTNNCQTIDSVTVDTGSSGMRVLSSVLSSTLTLPQQNATTGSPLVECMQFDDGYTWGSVRLADVKIGGEVAGRIPIQVIGDPAFSAVPTTCSSSGSAEDTVATFGSNGLIGINQIVADCGSFCAGTPAQSGAYYSCAGATCTPVAVAEADQVPNPIASFGVDSNGSLLQFPSAPAAGEVSLTGSLVFGIGTKANNGLGSATVLTVDSEGNFTTIFNGQTLATSFIDSGTNSLSFNDTSIAQCTSSDLSGYYCPTAPVSLTAQNKGINNVTSNVSLSVESADTLFSNASYTVFDDLATTGIDNNTFDWGFPFFLGRTVYVALDGATTPGGAGPYFAY